MKGRITPVYLNTLKPNQCFVFGSNTIGKHGKGAAKDALKWGAKYGQGVGLARRTYGIPTKGNDMNKRLTIAQIKPYVDDFIRFAKANPRAEFLVTEIGCGLSGYKPKDIAPLFIEAKDIQNIHLPYRFWHKILNS